MFFCLFPFFVLHFQWLQSFRIVVRFLTFDVNLVKFVKNYSFKKPWFNVENDKINQQDKDEITVKGVKDTIMQL